MRERRARKFPKGSRALFALIVGVLLLAALIMVWYGVGYLPVYGAERRFWGVLLMVIGIAGFLVALIIWYIGYDRLRMDLIRDYGARCFAPVPIVTETEEDEDDLAEKTV